MAPLGVVALVIALLCLADSCLADGVTKLLRDGDAALANSEYTSAVRYYSSAIEQSPKTALLYTKRAAAYISLRQLSQALRDLDKAVDCDATFVQGYLNRGKLQRQMCNFDAAERDCNKVLELRPGQKVAEQELARIRSARDKLLSLEVAATSEATAHLSEREREQLEAVLQSLYEDAPDCGKAQVLEAKLYFAQREYEQVVAVTGRLLKADDRQLEALVLRGRAYFYLADHDMAKRHFGEALKFDPDYAPARKEFNKVKDYDRKKARAERAAAENDWQQAERAFAEALHVDPDHYRGNDALWLGLCKARRALGLVDAAVEACGAVLVLDPGHREAKLLLVEMLMDAERFEEANAKAREFLQQHRDDGAFHQMARDAERRLKMSKRKDYYKILGVDKDAAVPDIKRAYRDLAKKYHPDKVSADEREAAEAQFREIAEAYEVLSDEEKRNAYDNGHDVDEAQHMQQQHWGFHHGGGMRFNVRFG